MRSAVFAEWVTEHVLPDVGHRHVVFTVPNALRGLIERERWLHGEMAKAALESDAAPGVVVSLQTFDSFGANFHPHLHALCPQILDGGVHMAHGIEWEGERGVCLSPLTRTTQALTRSRVCDRPQKAIPGAFC